MSMFIRAGFALALVAPLSALAQAATQGAPAAASGSEIAALRQEIESIRSAYEARLRALEQRLRAAESPAGAGAEPALAATASPATPASPARPAVAGAAGAGANAFNPAMSLILSGLYARTSKDPSGYRIAGFPLPEAAEVGPGSRGFSLAETELGFSASVDPWWRGVANIALHPDDAVSVEEAYVQTTALGNGLTLKAGRFFSGVGYLNPQHAHTWDFVDNPLAYQALLGTQYGDDGVQMSWLAPTDQYLELGAELGRGRGYPGGDNGRNGAGMTALTLHTGGDLGDSHNWRAGASVLNAKAGELQLPGTSVAGDEVTNAFSGNTRVVMIDGVWKWAPGGNATRTSFKLQGEYLRATRTGSLVYDVALANSSAPFRVVQSGWYLQGVYQFVPRWRVGLRTERLDPGTPHFGANAGLLGADNHTPRKNALMVDFSPSEFSRVRLQLARDQSRPGTPDNQIFLQYQMSLGAHGAHGY